MRMNRHCFALTFLLVWSPISILTFNPLIPQQNCYFQSHNHRLNCQCDHADDSASLTLRMKYYVFEEEIKTVQISRCKDLVLILDLKRVSASDFQFKFKQIATLKMEEIRFENTFVKQQTLELNFDNVDLILFQNLQIEDAIKIKVRNAREAHFIDSYFERLPKKGLDFSRIRKVNIDNTTFRNVSPQSISIEKVRKATIANNQMNLDSKDVVQVKDKSRVIVSCNRFINQRIDPECTKTTTKPKVETTTPGYKYRPNYNNIYVTEREPEFGKTREELWNELIIGIIAGAMIILISILVIICMVLLTKRKRRRLCESRRPSTAMVIDEVRGGHHGMEEERAGAISMTTEESMSVDEEKKEEEQKKEEQKSLIKEEEDEFKLGKEVNIVEDPVVADDEDEDDEKPKFVTPVYLEEIQKNKIFTQQKSLLDRKRRAPLPPQMPAQIPKPPVVTKAEAEDPMGESSRTESEEDIERRKREEEIEQMVEQVFLEKKKEQEEDVEGLEDVMENGEEEEQEDEEVNDVKSLSDLEQKPIEV